MAIANNSKRCCFCGKDINEISKLGKDSAYLIQNSAIDNGGFGVCMDCARRLAVKIAPQTAVRPNTSTSSAYNGAGPGRPSKIREFLDAYVIGQDEAKIALSVAAYNHFKRIRSDSAADDGVEIQKSNVLLAGPTGSGKTHLIKTLAKALDVPVAIADATSMTQHGFVGEDVESCLTTLLDAAGGDIARAERGIVYIDEFDKIAKDQAGGRRDVTGDGVQRELLRLMEGTKVNVPVPSSRKSQAVPGMRETVELNTENILFICGGAFAGMHEAAAKPARTIRFGAAENDASAPDTGYDAPSPEELVSYGFMPELVGRIPVITATMPLGEDDLVRILTEPKNAIVKQYQKLFSMDGIALSFTDSALHTAAKLAMERKSGARGLRAVLENAMSKLMYEGPDMKEKVHVVDAESIRIGNAKTRRM